MAEDPTQTRLTFFPQQLRAVTAPVGPVLVLAGPGAGKTRCLTGRISHLIAQGSNPARICAITFTNKAAQEIRIRLFQELGDLSEHLTLGTIHSLCLELLRSFSRQAGLPAGFGVADEAHQRLILNRLGVHSKRFRQLLLLFGRRRLQGYSLTAADEGLYRRYQRELRSHYLIDYDEILDLARRLLEDTEAIRAAYRLRWDHLLVDEFQDLDATQYRIVRLLAEEHRSLFAVGDDEQSIFTWRGADPQIIAHLLQDFGIAEPILLDINCRCSKAIFEVARKILPPQEFFAKHIEAVRESRFPLRAVGMTNEAEEVKWVVQDLQADLAQHGLPKGQYAVLYRTHDIGQRFEEAMIAAGIPCQLGKGQALVDDLVIGQVIASLRVILYPESDLEVECLAEVVLNKTLLAELARTPGETFLGRTRAYAEQKTGPEAAACWRFLYQVENLKGLGRISGGLREVVEAILAQGLGGYDNPLESCHEKLTDPEELPVARNLGEQLLRTQQVLLAPAGGLEIPVKVMLQRVLPNLHVRYLTSAPEENGLVLDVDSIGIMPVFKALQYVESRSYRKLLSDYVAFDTETTGKDIDCCEVIELAAVKVHAGQIIEEFHSLVRPNCPVSPGAIKVHGYTDVDLKNQPSLAEVWSRYRNFVGDLVQIAHNGHQFDIPILKRQAPPGGVAGMVFLDTLTLARSLYSAGSLSLVSLAERFNIPTGRSHHALDDSRCLVAVFERLQEERLRRSRKTCLPNLLDCVALGMAIENRGDLSDEEKALRQANPWRSLRQSSLVDIYLEEADALGGRCLALNELIERMDSKKRWGRAADDSAATEHYPEAYARLFRLLANVQAEGLQDGIRQFLDMVALSRSDGSGVDRERVSLLTFHATKGLEFSRVYIVGVEDYQLPGYYPMKERRETEIRESRRLFYVAMTRAKDRLTLTYCKERNGRPTGGTMFLEELGLVVRKKAVCR